MAIVNGPIRRAGISDHKDLTEVVIGFVKPAQTVAHLMPIE
jgi:hypothetical protein